MTQHEKFLADRIIRAENKSHAGEPGRCKECGRPETGWCLLKERRICSECRARKRQQPHVMDIFGFWGEAPIL